MTKIQLGNFASRILLAGAAIALVTLATTSAQANNFVGDLPCESCVSDGETVTLGGGAGGRSYGQPDLFYNYYTQGYSNQLNAQMYLSPGPIPPNGGHTFYTYQPFYPHEMLYWHKDKYHRYYDNGRGMNRTRATYYAPPVRQAFSNVYWNYLRLPR